eukprot:9743-Eustigmatos_ZCMA.PRE.1
MTEHAASLYVNDGTAEEKRNTMSFERNGEPAMDACSGDHPSLPPPPPSQSTRTSWCHLCRLDQYATLTTVYRLSPPPSTTSTTLTLQSL